MENGHVTIILHGHVHPPGHFLPPFEPIRQADTGSQVMKKEFFCYLKNGLHREDAQVGS